MRQTQEEMAQVEGMATPVSVVVLLGILLSLEGELCVGMLACAFHIALVTLTAAASATVFVATTTCLSPQVAARC